MEVSSSNTFNGSDVGTGPSGSPEVLSVSEGVVIKDNHNEQTLQAFSTLSITPLAASNRGWYYVSFVLFLINYIIRIKTLLTTGNCPNVPLT